ncbi:tRNA(Arg) A34 adenosine deaminase TadA [Stackebrandtia endophytica]|uniref:tRNA(Arg) A34 adenosine deaminase TadA n=1 Tax=Stackebrandtia endophytica TaxID=1496996 RepID=A0A543B3I4_9ACTN|nr:nucleoside deaminase [Stackebrandtia endophytica]TQL79353.1 tRNA(Arg) A34 adenosine deaminase TadA [Stackebrandtia endophytica]
MASSQGSSDLTTQQRDHLRRCVELAREALEAGDEPFGSILVDDRGTVRYEERNRVNSVDPTRHPEFDIARWAGANLTARERHGSTVYTSGEHCPMCSTAHALVGLGPIRYATSFQQLRDWRREWGLTSSPTVDLPIAAVAPQIDAAGPFPEFTDEIRALHARLLGVEA